MSTEGTDLHGLDPRAFVHEVHTFEFWFESVEGYLSGTHYGRRDETQDVKLDPGERDRLISVLCNYCVGETAALEGAGGLIRVAPNRDCMIFLSTQVVDEGRHTEVFLRRLRDLGVGDPDAEIARRASPNLVRFKQRLLELVTAGDWVSAIFAQNVILEAMEFAAFRAHAQIADPVTRDILQGVIKDERRHMGFGENDLGRRFQFDPSLRDRVRPIKQELDQLVLRTFQDTTEQLSTPADRRDEIGRAYLDTARRLGFP